MLYWKSARTISRIESEIRQYNPQINEEEIQTIIRFILSNVSVSMENELDDETLYSRIKRYVNSWIPGLIQEIELEPEYRF